MAHERLQDEKLKTSEYKLFCDLPNAKENSVKNFTGYGY